MPTPGLTPCAPKHPPPFLLLWPPPLSGERVHPLAAPSLLALSPAQGHKVESVLTKCTRAQLGCPKPKRCWERGSGPGLRPGHRRTQHVVTAAAAQGGQGAGRGEARLRGVIHSPHRKQRPRAEGAAGVGQLEDHGLREQLGACLAKLQSGLGRRSAWCMMRWGKTSSGRTRQEGSGSKGLHPPGWLLCHLCKDSWCYGPRPGWGV